VLRLLLSLRVTCRQT